MVGINYKPIEIFFLYNTIPILKFFKEMIIVDRKLQICNKLSVGLTLGDKQRGCIGKLSLHCEDEVGLYYPQKNGVRAVVNRH